MSRELIVAGAQLGPVEKDEPRSSAVNRMCGMMRQAAAQGAQLVVFPELALTTFFPRSFIDDQKQIDTYFETQMPNPAVQPLFDLARKLNTAFYLGYAELVSDDQKSQHFNTSILVDGSGTIIGKYRKVHLPGHFEHEPWRPFQHLEKRYFETGNLGFPVFDGFGGKMGMCLCNDRRWPETFRVLGLQGVELTMLGYNTPVQYPPAPEHDHLQDFHNHLVMQAGAYQNGTWVVGIAKAGKEDGCDLIGGSCIIAPTGEIVAQCTSLDDEVIVYPCELDRCREIRDNIFNFKLHRVPATYSLITATNSSKTSS